MASRRPHIFINPRRTMPGAWPYTPPSSPDTSDDERIDHGSLRTLSTPFNIRRLSPLNDPPKRNNDRSLYNEVFASTMTAPINDPSSEPSENNETNDSPGAVINNSKSRYGESTQNKTRSHYLDRSHQSQLPSPSPDGTSSEADTLEDRYTKRENEAIARSDQPLTPRSPSPARSDRASICSFDHSSDFRPLEDPRYRISDIGKAKRWKVPSAAQDPIRDLPPAWEEKVKQAVKLGHGQFSRETMARILPSKKGSYVEGWLNDDAVNEYLNLIAKSYNQSTGCDSTTPPACHSFGSFFMQSLKNRGPSKMSSWARRAKLEGQRLLEADIIFFPICENNHWTLMVLFPKKRRVEYYNSMSGGAAQHTSRLQQFLETQLGQSFDADEWYFERDSTPCPQQDNIIDCGVFATLAAKYLSLGLDLSYSPSDIPLQRKIMVGELMKGAFFGAPPLDAGF